MSLAGVRAPAYSRLGFVATFAKTMPIVLIVSLLVGGSVSLAAQSSLPGDFLYPVKVGVNEKARGLAALSTESQIRWEAALAGRRLDEATELAAKGELDAQAAARVEANFEDHVDRISERLLEFGAEKDFQAAAEVASDFETSLEAREKILTGIRSKNTAASDGQGDAELAAGADARSGGGDQVAVLISKIRARSKTITKTRLDIEARLAAGAQADIKMSAEGKLKSAEAKIAEAKRHILKIRQMLGADATVQAEARLTVAQDTVLQGKAKLDAKAYGEAFVLFQQADRIAQEAKLLIEARKRFQIDIRLNGSPETEPTGRPGKEVSSESEDELQPEDDGELELELDHDLELEL
jgi:hypothetical protein